MAIKDKQNIFICKNLRCNLNEFCISKASGSSFKNELEPDNSDRKKIAVNVELKKKKITFI